MLLLSSAKVYSPLGQALAWPRFPALRHPGNLRQRCWRYRLLQTRVSESGCLTPLQKQPAEVLLSEYSSKRWSQHSLLMLLVCELQPRHEWWCPQTSLDSKGDPINLYPEQLQFLLSKFKVQILVLNSIMKILQPLR